RRCLHTMPVPSQGSPLIGSRVITQGSTLLCLRIEGRPVVPHVPHPGGPLPGPGHLTGGVPWVPASEPVLTAPAIPYGSESGPLAPAAGRWALLPLCRVLVFVAVGDDGVFEVAEVCLHLLCQFVILDGPVRHVNVD